MNKLLEAAKAVLNQYSKSRSYLSADIGSDVMEALRQAVNEAERKPVSEPVAFRAKVDGAWFVASAHKFMKATLEKSDITAEIQPLYIAPPSIDELISEIDGLERIDFDEGGCDYPCSDGDNYRFDDVRAVLGKYRRAK